MVGSTPAHSCNPWHIRHYPFISSPGTVVADIAKSRAKIESARLLVLSAALQESWFLIMNADSSHRELFTDRQTQGEGCYEGDRDCEGKFYLRCAGRYFDQLPSSWYPPWPCKW